MPDVMNTGSLSLLMVCELLRRMNFQRRGKGNTWLLTKGRESKFIAVVSEATRFKARQKETPAGKMKGGTPFGAPPFSSV